jgi:hypothetical protein
MRPGREADQSPPFGAEVNNCEVAHLLTPYTFMARTGKATQLPSFTRLKCESSDFRPPLLPSTSLKIHYSPVILQFESIKSEILTYCMEQRF